MPSVAKPRYQYVEIALIDSGFVEALNHWEQYINDREGQILKGRMTTTYFLNVLRLPQTPSRLPNQSELQSLQTLAKTVDNFRQQRNEPSWDSWWESVLKSSGNLGPNNAYKGENGPLAKSFRSMHMNSQSECIKYIKEVFELGDQGGVIPMSENMAEFTPEGRAQMLGLEPQMYGLADSDNLYDTVSDVLNGAQFAENLNIDPDPGLTYADYTNAEFAEIRGQLITKQRVIRLGFGQAVWLDRI